MRRTHALRAGLVSVVVALGMSAAALPAGAAGPTGADGVGDRLYPQLGNGGYDALHYALDLSYDRVPGAANSKIVTMTAKGSVTMSARATQPLARFDLDYSGDPANLGALTVNGAPARWTKSGEDIVVTPARQIANGSTFTVVAPFTATSNPPDGSSAAGTAFFGTAEGTATAGQADGMHHMYPSSDHPSDKATFTFRLSVPSADTAVANGELTGKRVAGARTTWTYDMRQPMATELTQIAVGAYTVVSRGSVGGVAVRDVVPTRIANKYRADLAVEKNQLTWMTDRVGRYPFPVYGTLVVQQPDLGFALETQTLSIFDTTWFDRQPVGVWSPTMVHELAHQWFGDSVAPSRWSDIWQNEGHATWYEITWAEEKRQLTDDYGFATVDELMRALYAEGDQARHDHGPVARPLSGSVDDLFSTQAYEGGALVLYALRQKVGPARFAAIERAWAQSRSGRSAGTDDFIATASATAGQDLGPFLRAWLYELKTPPMPGHPDWTVDPVDPAARAAAAPADATPVPHRRR